MSTILPSKYRCYHCGNVSLEIFHTESSHREFQRLTEKNTDGSVVIPEYNFPVYMCQHCEKFVVADKMRLTGHLLYYSPHSGIHEYFEAGNNFLTLSKKAEQAREKVLTNYDSDEEEKELWLCPLTGTTDVIKAIKSKEFAGDKKIQYLLHLKYWHEWNRFHTEEDSVAMQEVTNYLLGEWEGKTDERYILKAELFRNIGEFKKCEELLLNAEEKYSEIIQQNGKWVKVILTLCSLNLQMVAPIKI